MEFGNGRSKFWYIFYMNSVVKRSFSGIKTVLILLNNLGDGTNYIKECLLNWINVQHIFNRRLPLLCLSFYVFRWYKLNQTYRKSWNKALEYCFSFLIWFEDFWNYTGFRVFFRYRQDRLFFILLLRFVKIFFTFLLEHLCFL